jgi:hypothetical protein
VVVLGQQGVYDSDWLSLNLRLKEALGFVLTFPVMQLRHGQRLLIHIEDFIKKISSKSDDLKGYKE